MGIINYFKGFFNDISTLKFAMKMQDLSDKGDSQTSTFTNVRRVDNVFISSYAIDAALDDFSPVWLNSDQGKLLLLQVAPSFDVEHKIIPPLPGEYIFVCDYNAHRQDVKTKHFRYIRDAKTSSNDIFAYLFEESTNTLICTINPDATKTFKKIIEYRRAKASPETARVTIEVSRKNQWTIMWEHFFSFNVYLDGIKIGTVSNGGTKLFGLLAGTHELKIKNFFGLEQSNPVSFDIQQNQHLKFSCKYSLWAQIFPYFSFLPKVKGIELEQKR